MKKIMERVLCLEYHLLEKLDGERTIKILPYKWCEKEKVKILLKLHRIEH